MAPSPLAISALLGLQLGVLPLSRTITFFRRSIWKATFIWRNSHELLIGRDESMTECFSSIIRWSGGQSKSERARLCARWTVRQLVLYQDTLSLNTFRRTKAVIVYACLMSCLFVMMCLPVFKVPLQRNATEMSLERGLAGFRLSFKNQIYCPLGLCNFQFASLFLYHSTTVDFSASPSFVPVRLFDWRSRGVKKC